LGVPARDALDRAEKKFAKIQHRIMETDKHQRRLLQDIDLAIERITTGVSIWALRSS
jgi:RNA polymerase-binding transcription factor DksA